jgi:predicted Zn-dependent protease
MMRLKFSSAIRLRNFRDLILIGGGHPSLISSGSRSQRQIDMAVTLAVATVCSGQAPLPEPVTDQETELGLAVYNELKAKGEIVETSPLYDTLRPIADAITRLAQPRYNHPFKFFVVHEPQANAFATPGGNVYVVDSLFYFVKNTEQFAGTLCHEVSHTIHRDAMKRLKEERESSCAKSARRCCSARRSPKCSPSR